GDRRGEGEVGDRLDVGHGLPVGAGVVGRQVVRDVGLGTAVRGVHLVHLVLAGAGPLTRWLARVVPIALESDRRAVRGPTGACVVGRVVGEPLLVRAVLGRHRVALIWSGRRGRGPGTPGST